MMFEKLKEYGTEEIHFCNDKESGLNAIVAIHSTVLGPTVGGTRFWPYENEERALFDVLRLSRGMTYKNAVSGLKYGGSKGVIIGDPAKLKTEKLLLAYARFVEHLNGLFTTGEDVNISVKDVEIMSRVTKHMAGIGGEGRGGDPSPYTARGVFAGMRAGAKEKFGSDSLKDKTVAVQGLGKVGYDLCKWLHKDGAKLIVADINEENVERAKKELGATAVGTSEILFADCDVFSPNAMGAVIKADDVSKLKCKLVAGGANNVLVDGSAGDALDKTGVLYIPDYVINAGGVISICLEIERVHDENIANKKMDGIYDNVKNLLDFAKKEGLPTYLAADKYAQKIVDDARKQKG
ncbi:MAG: leucine dehydrogenase [Spirochaetes bacterium]|nr:leucine dehydrogenase [Spirochaetota bacterium]